MWPRGTQWRCLRTDTTDLAAVSAFAGLMSTRTATSAHPRGTVMEDYRIKALGESTWDDFAAMVERNTGLFSGCWCTWFHAQDRDEEEGNRPYKERMVREGVAHAALVFEGNEAVAWAEYGTPPGAAEHPPPQSVRGRRGHATGLPDHLHLRRQAAPEVRARRGRSARCPRADCPSGSGRVVGYPQDMPGKKVNRHSSTTARGTRTRRPASSMTAQRARTTA